MIFRQQCFIIRLNDNQTFEELILIVQYVIYKKKIVKLLEQK